MQLKIDDEVFNHLLFHKSLIDEQGDTNKIAFYLDMLQKTNEGQHIAIDDPFDRSIAIAFELVINHHLNPWDIDLVGFSTMYLRRAKEEKIDLITAGKIIYMAWRVLKLQSDDLIIHMEELEQQPSPFGWEDIPTGMWLETDDGYSYTNVIMNMPKPLLEEPIRRDAKRKVTLIELLDAFGKARKDSETYQLLQRQREEERMRLAALSRKRMQGTAHEDHLEKDVETVWKRIQQYPKKRMTLLDLCERSTQEEIIKTFMSILFLSYDHKIHVYQQHFPFGKIYIRTIS